MFSGDKMSCYTITSGTIQVSFKNGSSPADAIEIGADTFDDALEYLAATPENLSKHYILVEDIDMSQITRTASIGDTSTAFTGDFNGNGKTLSNYDPISGTAPVALFGMVAGTVRDLTVELGGGTYTATSSGNSFGIITDNIGAGGSLDSIVLDGNGASLTLTSTVSGTNITIGGMVGSTSVSTAPYEVSGCTVKDLSIAVTDNSTDFWNTASLGGIIGSVDTTAVFDINDCMVDNVGISLTSNASRSQQNLVGGLVGQSLHTISMSECLARNSSIAISNAYTNAVPLYAGGLIASILGSAVINECAVSDINLLVSGSVYAGGLVGNCNGTDITNSYSRVVNISSTTGSTTQAGGIAGSLLAGSINYCYSYDLNTPASTGTVNAGGIAGNANSTTITNFVVFQGSIDCSGAASATAGYALGSGTVSKCYYKTTDDSGGDFVITGATTNSDNSIDGGIIMNSAAWYTTDTNWSGGAWDLSAEADSTSIWKWSGTYTTPELRNLPS